ncbi:hypothetical protein J4216_02455 [Candidatus Woesearchaeota archaeon]|nr:hypothetical protein [Candidatus Woesearchaeota archaeon]
MFVLKKAHRYFVGTAGVIGAILGMTIMVPSLMQDKTIAATLAGTLMVIGFILMAIALGD